MGCCSWWLQQLRPLTPTSTLFFSGQKTCIDCHKGIAHRLPDMRNVPGWQ